MPDHRTPPFPALATMLIILVGIPALPADSNKSGAPDLRVSVQTPKPGLRTLTPAEIEEARRKVLEQSQSEEAPAGPREPVAAPTPLPLLPPVERKLAPARYLPGPISPVGRVGDPDPDAPPAWSPAWSRRPLGAGRRTNVAEIVIEYQWAGLNAALSLEPEGGDGEAVRILMNRPGPVFLEVEPGFHTLQIEAWRPTDAARVHLYAFPRQEFRRGSAYSLALDTATGEKATAHLAGLRERLIRRLASPTPIVVESGMAGP